MLHLGQPPSQTGALMRRMLGHLDLWPADGDFTTKSVFIGSGSPRNGELCLSNHGQVGSGSGFAKTSHKAQYSAHAGRRGRTGGPAGYIWRPAPTQAAGARQGPRLLWCSGLSRCRTRRPALQVSDTPVLFVHLDSSSHRVLDQIHAFNPNPCEMVWEVVRRGHENGPPWWD